MVEKRESHQSIDRNWKRKKNIFRDIEVGATVYVDQG